MGNMFKNFEENLSKNFSQLSETKNSVKDIKEEYLHSKDNNFSLKSAIDTINISEKTEKSLKEIIIILS